MQLDIACLWLWLVMQEKDHLRKLQHGLLLLCAIFVILSLLIEHGILSLGKVASGSECIFQD